MNIEVLTPPPVEPVTAAEAFFQLKLTTDPEADVTEEPQYAEVSRQITAAREQVEQITRRAIIQQTILLTMPPPGRAFRGRSWDWVMTAGGRPWETIELLRPPLIEVVAVRYYDDSNTLVALDDGLDEDGDPDPDETVWYYTTGGLVPQLRFLEGFPAPSVYLREDAIQVEYTVGYPPLDIEAVEAVEADPEADPPVEAVEAVEASTDYRANVPASIKQAVLLGVQLQSDRLAPDERAAIERAQMSLLSSYRVPTL